jgi:O-acetylserine/cysteine efflux transporter
MPSGIPSAAGVPLVRTEMARSGLIALAASIVLFSSAWPVTKAALGQGATPLWFAQGRAVFSGLTAFVLVAALGRLRLPGVRDLPALLAVGIFQLAAFFALSHAAIAWVPAGRTAVLANTTTIWIVPLSLLFLPEPVPRRRWAAAALGLAGTAVLVSPWSIDWSSARVLLGNGFLLAAALCWSVAIIAVRRWPPRLTMLQLLPWCFGLASLLLLPLSLSHPAGAWRPGAWVAMAYIGLIAGPLGTWCVLQASAALPAMVASVGFLLTPAGGLILSALWLGERMGADLILGSALILAGVAAAAWPGRR